MPHVSISASVGEGGVNKPADVRKIQDTLNSIPKQWAGAELTLVPDSDCGPQTKAAIRNLQSWQFGWSDGLISPGGVTLARINEMLASTETAGGVVIDVKSQFSYPFVGQEKSMGCWAATGAMLISVRDLKQYKLVEALDKADKGPAGTFHLLFQLDTGLKWEYYEDFPKALGLKAEGGKTYPVSTIATWLKRGPVGLTLEFKNRIHVVTLTGLVGDGTVFGTYGIGYDPMGKNFNYAWRTLMGQYEITGHKTIWRI